MTHGCAYLLRDTSRVVAAIGWDRLGMTLCAAAFFGVGAYLWGVKRDRIGLTRWTKDWMLPLMGAGAGIVALALLGMAIAILFGA